LLQTLLSSRLLPSMGLWEGTESVAYLVNQPVRGLALSDTHVATKDDLALTLWNITGEMKHRIEMTSQKNVFQSHAIAFSADGGMLCTAYGAVYDVFVGKVICELPPCPFLRAKLRGAGE